jgi:MoaA/NifB/PqqE/SkfB family radical SAM enzyme
MLLLSAQHRRRRIRPAEKLTKLEKVLSSVKYFSMSSSIGEPLLHPDLRQILEWLYRINPTVLVA